MTYPNLQERAERLGTEPEILARAIELALATKLHGKVAQTGIESGGWDGEYITRHFAQAEAELIKHREEVTEE